MNPFLFKAHPLLQATIGLLVGAGTFSTRDVLALAATYLLVNIPLAMLLRLRVRKTIQVTLRGTAAFCLALPATVLYVPVLLTLLRDVVRHSFHLDERYLFLFALLVAAVLLAALFGVVLRFRNGDPVGSEIGLILALTLLLASMPYVLILLGLDGVFHFFPAS